ncbi:hypothetical protein H1R20_g12482, partial [Candolleomyces eurysporus]
MYSDKDDDDSDDEADERTRTVDEEKREREASASSGQQSKSAALVATAANSGKLISPSFQSQYKFESERDCTPTDATLPSVCRCS